jgi:nuclear transport factor 2 (NTF2) superfamily protein
MFGLLGVVLAVLSAVLFTLTAAWWGAALGTLVGLTAVTFLVQCGWMLYSSLVGKRRLWTRTLSGLGLSGGEQVLEVGPGRGAVLITAARMMQAGRRVGVDAGRRDGLHGAHLAEVDAGHRDGLRGGHGHAGHKDGPRSGHLVGVDIWRAQDQSGNGAGALLANARAAGVADLVEVRDGDMRRLPFPDDSFDLGLASLAVHNLPAGDRRGAVAELLRVVRPGGRIVILDFQGAAGYASTLREGGADVTVSGRHWSLHPPVRIVTATVNADQEVLVRPPVPPFTRETASAKVQAAEDAWNTRDPGRVALAYTEDSVWRNRDVFVTGRAAIIEFLTAKWERVLDYALRKSLWAFEGDRIAVRFQYECRDAGGQWWRSYGNELWEFDDHGLMRRREASINDLRIDESERRIFGPRPAGDRTEIPLH